ASGASVSVASNVPVLITGGQAFTDSGAVAFATGDVGTIHTFGYNNQITANGTLAASSTPFNSGGGGATIAVNSGGALIASNETAFNLSNLTLNSGSSATLTTDVLSGVFTINSNTILNVTGNDFSKLTTPKGLVAAGDPSA